ncbi:MAG: hypothetical protein KAG53_06865 [Endozoicomonadaceae bacterium]|nr:hypothetical protein [Endozoicomonadaceae bacterium]
MECTCIDFIEAWITMMKLLFAVVDIMYCMEVMEAMECSYADAELLLWQL